MLPFWNMAEITSSYNVSIETSRVLIIFEVLMDHKYGKFKWTPVRLRMHFSSQMSNWKGKIDTSVSSYST